MEFKNDQILMHLFMRSTDLESRVKILKFLFEQETKLWRKAVLEMEMEITSRELEVMKRAIESLEFE